MGTFPKHLVRRGQDWPLPLLAKTVGAAAVVSIRAPRGMLLYLMCWPDGTLHFHNTCLQIPPCHSNPSQQSMGNWEQGEKHTQNDMGGDGTVKRNRAC